MTKMVWTLIGKNSGNSIEGSFDVMFMFNYVLQKANKKIVSGQTLQMSNFLALVDWPGFFGSETVLI